MQCSARALRSAAFAFGLVAISAIVGHAKSPRPEDWTAEGAGFVPCGYFDQQYKNAPSQTGSFFVWTEGYLSGMDQTLEAEGEPATDLAGWGSAKQNAFIRAFCMAYPLKAYGDASTALFLAMRAEQRIPASKS